MPNLRFDQLVDVYRNIAFDADGVEGDLTIATAEILANLQLLEQDAVAADDANLAVLVDELPGVGDVVPVRAGAPRIGTGLLVRTLDDLLRAREARLHEPARYYIIDGAVDHTTVPVPSRIAAYRKVLAFVALVSECAAYVDPLKQELVFFRDRKVVIPVHYDASALARVSVPAIDALLAHFTDDVHRDQKRAILAETLITTAEPQPLADRFTYLLDNAEALNDAVKNGYSLFASSFSYARIRGEIEAAKVEYVSKIHKTLIDIQGQLLGIPIATVVVASQLKASTGCDLEAWTNRALLGGVWIFVVLLAVAIVNQWLTLAAIGEDIDSQGERLNTDYAAISERFSGVFAGLKRRIRWHYAVLVFVAGIAIAGAIFATAAYFRVTETPGRCPASLTSPTTASHSASKLSEARAFAPMVSPTPTPTPTPAPAAAAAPPAPQRASQSTPANPR